MMVSNRITTIPTQALFSDDTDIETSAIVPHEQQAYDGLYSAQKHTVSIVELGRRLRKCARLGNTDQVHELMTKGAPFTTDWLGTSALHLAAMNDHLETCEVLLRAGISRDSRTKVERTPLHLAAYEGHARICELLLTNKAEVDPRDMLRMTPLHWAVEKQHDAVIELLLQHGADPTIVSKFDKTPISIAIEGNRLDLAQLLQLAARLLAQQAELANAEETRQNHEDTLAATQSLDLELQQVDVTNVDTGASVPECKREMEDPQSSESMEDNVIDESFQSNNELENEEPTILKSANTTITSPSQITTLQLLQEHGITMLPTDEGGLVNNAIESGRTLVLSEAGKLMLAEGKKTPEKSPMPIIKQQRKIVIPNANLKNRKVITLTHEQFMAITKSQGNKPMLKKVSAEAFKKAAENAGVKYSSTATATTTTPLKSSPVISYAGSKLKRVTVIPTTATTKELNKSPMKVLNPAAVTGLLTSSNKPIVTLKTNPVQKSTSTELETTRIQLSKALVQNEELKRLLKASGNENRRLREQIEEMKAKEKISMSD